MEGQAGRARCWPSAICLFSFCVLSLKLKASLSHFRLAGGNKLPIGSQPAFLRIVSLKFGLAWNILCEACMDAVLLVLADKLDAWMLWQSWNPSCIYLEPFKARSKQMTELGKCGVYFLCICFCRYVWTWTEILNFGTGLPASSHRELLCRLEKQGCLRNHEKGVQRLCQVYSWWGELLIPVCVWSLLLWLSATIPSVNTLPLLS